MDRSGCHTCGDGAREAGEACDQADLDGETCESLGYHGGELACQQDCTHELSDCEAAGWCGDGIINGAEACDDGDSPDDAETWDGCRYCEIVEFWIDCRDPVTSEATVVMDASGGMQTIWAAGHAIR